MAKISYTLRKNAKQCKTIFRDFQGIPHRCKEPVSKGSEYCLACKHRRK